MVPLEPQTITKWFWWQQYTSRHQNTSVSCVRAGHCVVSKTSRAGKQPLFNLHQANLCGYSIHQGQLPIQSAGGYLHSPCSALVQTSTVSSVMNQGVACMAAQKASQYSQKLGGPTVWHCPAQTRTPLCCQCRDADLTSVGSNGTRSHSWVEYR